MSTLKIATDYFCLPIDAAIEHNFFVLFDNVEPLIFSSTVHFAIEKLYPRLLDVSINWGAVHRR